MSGQPGFAGAGFHWLPVLDVALHYRRAKSPRVEAIVDSGSPWCLFHAEIGNFLKIPVEQGEPSQLGGVIAEASSPVYFHELKLSFGDQVVDAIAGFSAHLSVAGILGRQGFFDSCVVTFDPSAEPPGLSIERFFRA